MKLFNDENNHLDDYYDKSMFGLSSEDRDYFSKLNDDKSMLNYNEDCSSYDDYDSGFIKHFQD